MCASLFWLAGCTALPPMGEQVRDKNVAPLQVVVGKKVRLPEVRTVQAENRQTQRLWKRLYVNTDDQAAQLKAILEYIDKVASPRGIEGLAVENPRMEEARFVARLDAQREVVADMNGTDWDGALYYAMRPEVRDQNAADFDADAFAVDENTFTVKLLGRGFEKEPYTGYVLMGGDDPNRLGMAIIERGILKEGMVTRLQDLVFQQLVQTYFLGEPTETARFQLDAIGQALFGRRLDPGGTELEQRDYRPAAMKQYVGNYTAKLGLRDEVYKLSLLPNGQAELFSNHVVPAGMGAWIFMGDEVHLLFPDKAFDIPVLERQPNRSLAVVATLEPNTGRRTKFAKGDRKNFPVYINPMPPNSMLASRVRIGGEMIYDKDDPGLIPIPFDGVLVDYYDPERYLKKREEPVKIGKHNGTVRWWYRHLGADGQQQPWFEAEYVNGDPEGRAVWYRADGSTEYEGTWTNGALTEATSFDAAKIKQGEVINGDGTLRFYHPNGQLRLEETYTGGKLSNSQFWDEEGNPIEAVEPLYIPARPRIILN